MICPKCNDTDISRELGGWRCGTCAYFKPLSDATQPFARPIQPEWTCDREVYPVYGARYVIRAQAFLFGQKLGSAYYISEDEVDRYGDRLPDYLNFVLERMQASFETAVAQFVLYGVLP